MPLLKAGIVLVDYDTGAVQRLIPLQYNPETLTRTLQIQGVGPESGPHVDQMRLKGPPIETFKLEADLDATDQLDTGDPLATASGIQPQLAALETVIYPDQYPAPAGERHGPVRDAGDRADGRAADAVRVEQGAHRPGEDHRVQHHRGDVRLQPEPDPGQGQPRACGCSRSTISTSRRWPAASTSPTSSARSSSRRAPRPARSPPSASAGCCS